MALRADLPPSTWDDPIRATQHTFRRTLDALALPGTIQQLVVNPTLVDLGASDAIRWPATLLLMLVDHEVSLAAVDVPAGEELVNLLVRRTRVAQAPPERADVVVTGANPDPDLLVRLHRGSLQFPDDSATLVILVDSLEAEGTSLTLTGPGVDGTTTISIPGFTPEVLAARATAVAQYPMGIDIFVLDTAGRLIGLPRTTQIARTEA